MANYKKNTRRRECVFKIIVVYFLVINLCHTGGIMLVLEH